MLRPRIIPCLLVHNKGLVKTMRFSNPKYIGDPINVVRIFNEKEVDELIVLDIDATIRNKEPDYIMISRLADECRMPLCYGGGVVSCDQVRKIISLGVEKVAISAAAVNNPSIVSDSASKVGSQSVVVVLDVIKKDLNNKYEIITHNASISTGKNPFELARMYEDLGAGELVINSVQNDGIMKGYDLNLVERIREQVNIPITILGGAGSLTDISSLIQKYGILGAAAGSLFVYKGIFKAVLINYPDRNTKDLLIEKSLINRKT